MHLRTAFPEFFPIDTAHLFSSEAVAYGVVASRKRLQVRVKISIHHFLKP